MKSQGERKIEAQERFLHRVVIFDWRGETKTGTVTLIKFSGIDVVAEVTVSKREIYVVLITSLMLPTKKILKIKLKPNL